MKDLALERTLHLFFAFFFEYDIFQSKLFLKGFIRKYVFTLSFVEFSGNLQNH